MEFLKKAKDKDFWKEVQEKDCFKRYRDELLETWEKYCEGKTREALKYSDFKLFWTTGDRKTYEAPYFARRIAMTDAALLSLVYPEEEKYIVRLMDEIYTICDEYTWCLPAHQGELEPNNNARIDLFASETGFSLAEIYTLLKDRLDPLIKNRIKAEIERRIFTPFTEVENYGWWESGTNNWTAVCTCSVAGAFMLLAPERAKALLPRFNKAMDSYLSGFKDDGICTEGCGYWHYGFGFFTVYADMLRDFTDGEMDYFKLSKIKTISTFIQKMFLSGNACVSFSDGNRTLAYQIGICHYLKSVYPDDVVVYDPKYSYLFDGNAHFSLHLRAATWFSEEYYASPAPDDYSSEFFASDSEWFIKRTSEYGFAAKGGNNAEPHNNNDVGTFIFAKGGRQLLMDIGAGVYTRQYFGTERYTILECSSRGHSVPIIGECLQSFGSEFAAADTKFENGIFSTEISGAYACPELHSLKRSFSFTERCVTLCDEFSYTGEGDIVERIVSLYEPKIKDGAITVEDATIKYDSNVADVKVNFETREGGDVCYFIDFKLKNDGRKFVCEIF